MQIVWCLGGLGNQMFQYAFYRKLELMGKEVYLDLSEFNNYDLHNGFELQKIFAVAPKIIPSIAVKKFRQNKFFKVLARLKLYQRIISQSEFNFNSKYLDYSFSRYLIGYWQSESYFAEIERQIREDFTFPSLDAANQLIANQIRSTNAISLHVRMGDYVNHPLHGGICTKEFYLRAIDIIKDKVEDPQFFIFSNEIDWCKNNLPLANAVYVGGNDGENSYRDMQLMSLCKHNIIANSSFSWWGAWLNSNINKIVIAPAKWFNDPQINTSDLLPASWVKI